MSKLSKYRIKPSVKEMITKEKKEFFVKKAKKYTYSEVTDKIVEGLWKNIEDSSIYELTPTVKKN